MALAALRHSRIVGGVSRAQQQTITPGLRAFAASPSVLGGGRAFASASSSSSSPSLPPEDPYAPKTFKGGWTNDSDFSDIDLSKLSGMAKENPLLVRRHGMDSRDGEFRPMAEIPTEHLPENAHMTLWDPRGSEPLFDYIERPFDKEVMKSMLLGVAILASMIVYNYVLTKFVFEDTTFSTHPLPTNAQPFVQKNAVVGSNVSPAHKNYS